ncbi:hypothetical protein DID88_006204 [Monilinia fructigena]|uniref:Uncharacterized protein n=1 Tax=Monilinia fructigena TaxID=38457 RepID=A0A395J363_9HELO|nr:hypothetical protein DID88_006204 [Monilinia fructigena]
MLKHRRTTSDARPGDEGGNGRNIRGGGGTGGTGGADGGDNGGDKGNGKRQNKGKVPQEFADCRICDGKFHWESDCRKNATGVGKRTKDSPKCRECTGNHWEHQCRTWKSKNPGGNNNRPETPNAGTFLAPTGEDITQFFPKGKFPRRPCSKCNVLGHWNDACEKEGFDPVTNPNPGAKNEKLNDKRVHFQDDFNANQPPLGTQIQEQPQQPQGEDQEQQSQEQQSEEQQQNQQPQARQKLPPVNFGYAQTQTQYHPNYNYLPEAPATPITTPTATDPTTSTPTPHPSRSKPAPAPSTPITPPTQTPPTTAPPTLPNLHLLPRTRPQIQRLQNFPLAPPSHQSPLASTPRSQPPIQRSPSAPKRLLEC